MIPARSIAFACVAAMALALTAQAQTSIAKVAIANPAKIFNEIQETKDLKVKMESERRVLESTDLEKKAKLRDLQAARDQLKPDSPQYADRNKELLQATIDYQVWGQIQQAEIQRQQKVQMKALFDKITTAVAEVGTQKGIDLVIAEQRPEFPESLDQINVDQLRLLINQRNVLFNTAIVDISNDVIAAMDRAYKTGR